MIAIGAISGGGKTAITSHLSGKLHHSKALFFDDYDFGAPSDIIEWVDNGSDHDEWDLSPLIKDIKQLLNEPLDYIILDFPFAYLHRDTSQYIDLAVFIDTPLDIAMARRITRDFKGSSAESILLELDNYSGRTRWGYLDMLKTTKPNSDLTVDGTLSVSEIVGFIEQNIPE